MMHWRIPSKSVGLTFLCALLCAPLLGACGPMTDIYVTSAAGPDGQANPLGALEIDIEECHGGTPPKTEGGIFTAGVEQSGFLAIGSTCQLPIRWRGQRGDEELVRHFTLLGGPYRCTLHGEETTIHDVVGSTVANDLKVTLQTSTSTLSDADLRPSSTIFVTPALLPAPARTVELQGERGATRPSQMLCGLPVQPYVVSRR